MYIKNASPRRLRVMTAQDIEDFALKINNQKTFVN
jgi:hypothetical protein